MGIETPCVNICVINETAGLCEGCGRTLDEVGSWTKFSKEQRLAIMAELPDRLANLERTDDTLGTVDAEAAG